MPVGGRGVAVHVVAEFVGECAAAVDGAEVGTDSNAAVRETLAFLAAGVLADGDLVLFCPLFGVRSTASPP